jgi:hypothetical protein
MSQIALATRASASVTETEVLMASIMWSSLIGCPSGVARKIGSSRNVMARQRKTGFMPGWLA